MKTWYLVKFAIEIACNSKNKASNTESKIVLLLIYKFPETPVHCVASPHTELHSLPNMLPSFLKASISFRFPFSCWSNWHNYENEISPQKKKYPKPQKQPLCNLCTLNPHICLLMKFLFKRLLLCWYVFSFQTFLVLHFVFIIIVLNFFLVCFVPCQRCSWSKPQKSFKQNIIHPLWFLFIFSWMQMKNNSCWHKRYKSCHQVHQQENVWNVKFSFQ